ncbi:MAG: SagB/ThcOx family dehydrogenase [Solirubrobacterales bacterium]
MVKEDLRELLKSYNLQELDNIQTDQEKDLPQPSVQKNCHESQQLIDLCPVEEFEHLQLSFLDTLKQRKSRRQYSGEALTLEELSFLLWSTQGVKKIVNNGYATLRTVPSAGARHPFETYLIVNNVKELNKGLYRYLPLEHKLVFEKELPLIKADLTKAVLNQQFVAESDVIFIWAAVPYRTEWRYETTSAKLIAIDAGHVCENLYLAAEVVNAGVCAIAAYDQDNMDSIIGTDGKDEFTIYLASVGKQ